MNIQDIQSKVYEIVVLVGDHTPWKAHALEDELSAEFIEFIKDNAPEPYASMAAEVLKSHQMDFERWYE